MWKDFFYFSKGQRIAISILILLIIIVITLNVLMPRFFPSQTHPFDENIVTEVTEFKKNLVSIDSLKKIERQIAYENKYNKQDYNNENYETKTYTLFNFDPNTADSISFVKLGLKSYIISNILKYRAKGAKFTTKESFSKIYGITDEKFNELESYIQIAKSVEENSDSAKNTQIKKEIPKEIIAELNTADSTLLMKIKGIGRFYAKGIIILRNSLGGYVSVDQLREVYGMKEENFVQIRKSFTVNPELIKRIDINTASVSRLKNHPYLNFYQAKEIYELRRNKGKLTDINELQILENMDESDLKKIAPYLSFE
jgi:DNA uptake protein ComE-like DNA-binding protein